MPDQSLYSFEGMEIIKDVGRRRDGLTHMYAKQHRVVNPYEPLNAQIHSRL